MGGHGRTPHAPPSAALGNESPDADAAPAAPAAGLIAFGAGLHAKVLVLNRAYLAVRVTSARRAFCLLSRGMAEVIHVDDGKYANYDFATWTEISELQRAYERDAHDWVRTVRLNIAVPKIIRLLGYDRLPHQTVKLNRRNLFARDGNRCQYCGDLFPTSELTLDHVTPRAHGGGETWENLVCSCVRCNARKGGRTPEQAHMRLWAKPHKPRRNPLITIRLGQEKYASWKAFLDEAYWSVELR
jgi:5-methylcytosine-specific restriction endonuclease McrA